MPTPASAATKNKITTETQRHGEEKNLKPPMHTDSHRFTQIHPFPVSSGWIGVNRCASVVPNSSLFFSVPPWLISLLWQTPRGGHTSDTAVTGHFRSGASPERRGSKFRACPSRSPYLAIFPIRISDFLSPSMRLSKHPRRRPFRMQKCAVEMRQIFKP